MNMDKGVCEMTSVCVGHYKDWPIFETLPAGWVIDKTSGSPLHGYVFCTNGINRIHNDHKTALVKAVRTDVPSHLQEVSFCLPKPKPETKSVEEASAESVNRLARERFKLLMLADIRADLMVCEIEGWCKKQYINELKLLINSIG